MAHKALVHEFVTTSQAAAVDIIEKLRDVTNRRLQGIAIGASCELRTNDEETEFYGNFTLFFGPSEKLPSYILPEFLDSMVRVGNQVFGLLQSLGALQAANVEHRDATEQEVREMFTKVTKDQNEFMATVPQDVKDFLSLHVTPNAVN